MKIVIPKESLKGENRVAISTDVVKKLILLGFDVMVEKDAGVNSSITDAQLKDAGAKIAKDKKDLYSKADVVFRVRHPELAEIKLMPKGVILIAMLSPYNEKASMDAVAKQGITAFTMEFVPRITRAQSMDVLSSQSNLAGYKSVLEAANIFGRAFPMMMTAAGTVPPAKTFIMGAGVAGLQAIATAKRLGAVVSATDVRAASKEQVQSLGGNFVMVENEETANAETSGGYAKEMSADYKKQQAALIAKTIEKQDIVITTALIPGRPAPVLVTEAMVKSMKPGSVIIDMAVEQGGNCTLSKPDQIVEKYGVKIVGFTNMAGRIADSASVLYAKNLLNFLTPMVKEGKLNFDLEEEILKASLLTHAGKIVHEAFGGSAPKKVKKPVSKKKTAVKAKAKTVTKAKTKVKAKPKAKATTVKKAVPKKTAPKKKTAVKKATIVKKKTTNKGVKK